MWNLLNENKMLRDVAVQSLVTKFSSINSKEQVKILNLVKDNAVAVHEVGQGIGYNFSYLNFDMQEKILDLAEKNENFADGFGFIMN